MHIKHSDAPQAVMTNDGATGLKFLALVDRSLADENSSKWLCRCWQFCDLLIKLHWQTMAAAHHPDMAGQETRLGRELSCGKHRGLPLPHAFHALCL